MATPDQSQNLLSSETPAPTGLGLVNGNGSADANRRHRFNELLVSLCVDFLNRPVKRLADGLQDALRRIGQFTQVDRCFIYNFSPDGSTISLGHEWVADGAPTAEVIMESVPAEKFAWEVEQMVTHGRLHFPDVSALPPEAEGFRWLFQQLGVVSTVLFPMFVEGRLVAVLGFSNIERRRPWSETDFALASVFSEVLVSVLERGRAEQALSDSEKRFRDVVRDQTELIVRWKPSGEQHFVNEAVSRFLQEPVADLIGASVFEQIHPDDLQAVREKLASLTVENPVATDEHRVLRPDGSVSWHQWVDRALFDDDRQIVEYQSVGRDITRLKDVQAELEHRLGFENLLLSLSMRFINLPLDRFDDELNEALRQVTEFTGVDRSFIYLFDEETLEARLKSEWAAPDQPPMPQVFHHVSLIEFPWAMEALRNGRPIHVPTPEALPEEAAGFRTQIERLGVKSYINVPMLFGDEVVGHLGCSCFKSPKTWSDDEIALLRLLGETLINALKRRETQEALAVSERRLRLTVESIEEGVFDWNIQTGHAYISDYLKRSVGIDNDSNGWSFEDWADRLHLDDRANVMACLESHLDGREPLYDAEYRFRTEQGGYRWMHSRGRVVEHLPDGRPLRMVGVQRDITQLIEQREERRRAEAQMVHLGRVAAMGETVAGIAHEVNQPLHAAATFCAAAREAIRSERPDSVTNAMELCDQAATQVRRAGDIIHRLREFTRPRPTEVAAVDINELVRQTTDFIEQLGASRGILTALDLDRSEPRVQADRVQLQQVLVNLIQNACDSLHDSGDPAPAMVVTTRRNGDRVDVAVRDNASMPPPQNPESLFDAFYTTKAEGMGIGLALCRTILTAYGGEIRAEANADRGMGFCFTLPLDGVASP